jgi:MFS transporter, DHA1 family, inner membrane transport protein
MQQERAARDAPGDSVASSRATYALLALGIGGFAIGTSEFVIMGLLPDVARDVGITIPEAGRFISAYALGVVVGAPALAVLTARWRRRALLVALMAFYAVGNLASALVTGPVAIGAMRFVSGLPHGTYFGVAALVAAALSPPDRRARAVGYVMLGLTSAMLAGAPVAAWLGQHFGWRAAFVLVSAIAALAALLIHRHVPDLPVDADASPLRELGALARPQVWMTLAIAGIGFGGMFCVYSYIKPVLIEASGFAATQVPAILSLFGVGAVVGNLVGAYLSDRSLTRTIGGVLLYSAVFLALFGLLARSQPTALFAVFLLGTLIAIGPALQIRLMDVAGDAQALAAALNHSAFNFANALGAALGGLVIAASWSWDALGWVGASLAIGGLVVFAASLVLARTRIALA